MRICELFSVLSTDLSSDCQPVHNYIHLQWVWLLNCCAEIEIKLNCSNSCALPQFSLILYPWIPWLKRTIFSIEFTLHDDSASLLLILWDLFWVSAEWEAEGKQFEFYNQSAWSKGGGKGESDWRRRNCIINESFQSLIKTHWSAKRNTQKLFHH